jgi:hypothetical protein
MRLLVLLLLVLGMHLIAGFVAAQECFESWYQVVVLLNEHNTSFKCMHCETQLDKKFSYRELPKPHISRRNRLDNSTNPRKYTWDSAV